MVSSTPRPHFTPGKDPVPILQEAGWAPGPVWTGGKSRPHRDSIPDRPACSQSLYRLNYRAHLCFSSYLNFYFYSQEFRRCEPPGTPAKLTDTFAEWQPDVNTLVINFVYCSGRQVRVYRAFNVSFHLGLPADSD